MKATSATRACIKTSISTHWRFMILIQENTAARQQTTDSHLEKLENNGNTSILSQLERLRRSPAHASDGNGAGRDKMHPNKNGEIHLILTGKSEIR